MEESGVCAVVQLDNDNFVVQGMGHEDTQSKPIDVNGIRDSDIEEKKRALKGDGRTIGVHQSNFEGLSLDERVRRSSCLTHFLRRRGKCMSCVSQMR